MAALARVTVVEHLGGRTLRVGFSDGLVRELDFAGKLPGVLAAIAAGLAVGVLMRGTVPPHLRIIGRAEGLPDLPDAGIVVVRGSRERPAILRLEAEIVEHFRAGRPLNAAA